MIKIMVDSASDCKKEDGIFDLFVPISVNIDGNEYFDGVDLCADKFYDLLQNCKDFPHTSQPSPSCFADLFEQIKADGDELIYFALSSSLSGTYQSANIAKNMTEYDGIYIIDTLNASHMIGLLAEFARNLIEKGLSAREIVEKCEDVKKRIRVFAGLDTLEYLRRGGRLSNASAVIGTLANIKPVITVTQNGTVESIGKCLGFGKAVQFVADKVKSCEIDNDFPVYSLYTFGEQNCLKLETKLEAEGINVKKRLQIGSTIGTHVGPGVYGIMFVTK